MVTAYFWLEFAWEPPTCTYLTVSTIFLRTAAPECVLNRYLFRTHTNHRIAVEYRVHTTFVRHGLRYILVKRNDNSR